MPRKTRPKDSKQPGEASEAPSKPLVFVDNPFDDERTDAVEGYAGDWDNSYVPGYSEARRENELRRAQGKDDVPIPKLYWARVSTGDGSFLGESDEGMMQTLQLGYVATGKDDLESMGFGMPPQAHVDENGLIRRGDAALFHISAERAERNRERKRNKSRRELNKNVGSSGAVYRPEGESSDRVGSLEEIAEMDPSL